MSNLLEQASLVLIPSGYKEDIVYSEIPINGSGDLQFTRSSNGTRINSAGLVEVCPWNLVQNSENFSAVWTAQNATITTNSIVAPNGTTTADSLIASNGVNGASGVYVPETTSVVKTISCYVKKGSKRWASIIGYNGNSNCWYDLDNGVVGTRGANYSTSSITSVGNGWYRIDAVMAVAIGADVNIGVYATDNDNALTCTGDGTTVSSYIWGAQLNIGSTAKPYFPTTDRLNVPRLTYQNGGGGCPSLLLEKQSTNLVTYSEQFDNAGWSKQNTSVTANATTSPDGTQNADKLIANTTNARHLIYQAFVVSTTHTFTTYAKAGENSFLIMRLDTDSPEVKTWFNLSNGTIGTSEGGSPSITSVGNGWYRCSVQFVSSTSQTVYAVLYTATTDGSTDFAGNGTDGLFAWGAQVEASSYPTSYIPTTSSSATRVADACSKTGISSLIGQTEGVIYIDFIASAKNQDGASYAYITNFGTSNDNMQLYTAGATLKWYARITAGQLFDQTANETLVAGQRYKIAYAYKSGDWALYINGVQKSTNTSANIPATSQFNFNTDAYGVASAKVENKFSQVLLFQTRLTNSQLAELTTI